MTQFHEKSRKELRAEAARLDDAYAAFQAKKLSLDITRGKPSPAQLDLATGLLDCLGPEDYRAGDGTDCRNYGGLVGLPEARELLAPVVGVSPELLVVAGNSSLALMHDTVVQALLKGFPESETPWGQAALRFLCPVPGYDRHFAICERFGIEMIPVAIGEDGPDMDEVERLVASDGSIKGIWCVPKYSNPTGVTYSAEVVQRLARMATKARDFRIFWDNAYAVHHLAEPGDALKNLFDACVAAGNPDRPLLFGSTSKVTFAGAGVAMVGCSEANRQFYQQAMSIRTIGPDKLNQLRHVRFFRSFAGVEEHMKKHAEILRPKFELVAKTLEEELGGTGLAEWSSPRGGYFVSLDTMDGCAARVVAMAAEAGLKLTGAGATFPLRRDPRDRNIRIAPSMPGLEELEQAMALLCVCVRRVSAQKLSENE